MAEVQKPTVEVPEVAKTETVPAEQAVATDAAPIVDATKPADESKPVDAAEAADAVKTEDKKDAIKPVDEGHLGHKDQGASFPK